MRGDAVKRILFGRGRSVAGTVYGTIVVMATIAAGSRGPETDTGRLAIDRRGHGARALDRARVLARPRGEPGARPAAGRRRVRRRRPPGAGDARGGAGSGRARSCSAASASFGEQAAVRLALGFGVATLAVQGVRYARARAPRPRGDGRLGGAERRVSGS